MTGLKQVNMHLSSHREGKVLVDLQNELRFCSFSYFFPIKLTPQTKPKTAKLTSANAGTTDTALISR